MSAAQLTRYPFLQASLATTGENRVQSLGVLIGEGLETHGGRAEFILLDGRYPGAQRGCRPCVVPGWSTLGALTGSGFARILPQQWGEGVQKSPTIRGESGTVSSPWPGSEPEGATANC
jgi:hypothetical protein